MNKVLVSLGIVASIATVVFAQGLGGLQVPGVEGPGAPRLNAPQMRGGGSVTATANEKFLFVVSNGTVYKLDVETLTVRAQAKLPTSDRGEGGQGGGRRGGGQPPV
jgi:hypothetical protein